MNFREKPTPEEFRTIINECNGNLTNAAARIGIHRVTLTKWAKEIPEYAEAIKDSRKKMFDKCLTTAQALAFGIPEFDDAGKLIGWVERPDGNMLRYFMTTLGRDEGFGENLDITTNGKDLNNIIQVEVIDKRSQVISNEENEDSDDEGV